MGWSGRSLRKLSVLAVSQRPYKTMLPSVYMYTCLELGGGLPTELRLGMARCVHVNTVY